MSKESIFENEEIRFHNGFPSLIRFYKGDPERPLIVFFPGWAHLGRISYGVPGSGEKNFLAYWLVKKGYSFLAISYPLDHPVYIRVCPEFALTDWGDMASGIANQIISEYKQKKEVIAIHWSASGQVIRAFNKACRKLKIDVRFALAIEASPALLIPSDRTTGLKKTRKNMVSLKDSHYGLFCTQLEEQSRLNGTCILSKEDYEGVFLGDIPVGIMGTDEFFENGSFVKDTERSMEDKRFFAFDEYPLVSVVSGDSGLAPYHPLVDKGTWSFLITRKVYHYYFVGRETSGFKISGQKFKEFVSYVNKLPDRLSKTVRGNHFLFVGEKGAKAVADCLEVFDDTVMKIKDEIASLLR